MSTKRVFLDTGFVQALFNRDDGFHGLAQSLMPLMRLAQVWTTELVLIEIGDALSARNRPAAIQFIDDAFVTPNIHVVRTDAALFSEGLTLYRQRLDKRWGMTDCISFVVMRQQQITDALTADVHFAQAGFNVLMKRI